MPGAAGRVPRQQAVPPPAWRLETLESTSRSNAGAAAQPGRGSIEETERRVPFKLNGSNRPGGEWPRGGECGEQPDRTGPTESEAGRLGAVQHRGPAPDQSSPGAAWRGWAWRSEVKTAGRRWAWQRARRACSPATPRGYSSAATDQGEFLALCPPPLRWPKGGFALFSVRF